MKKIWIKFDEIDSSYDDDTLFISPNLIDKVGDWALIHFGQRRVEVKILPIDVTCGDGSTFDRPLHLEGTPMLFERLLLKTSNVYQLQVGQGELRLGPVIGMLLGEQHYYYHNERMGEYTDAMSNYKNIGGLVYGFKSISVDWGQKCLHGLYFNHADQNWYYDRFPFPDVIYRRAFNHSEEVVTQLKNVTDGNVFNSRRFTKWELFEEVKNYQNLVNYLPETIQLDELDRVSNLLEKYKNIILKPIGSSRGRGICILQYIGNDHIHLTDYNDGTSVTKLTVSKRQVSEYIKQRGFLDKKYIVQPYLELAKINGSPWDIRVVMQKDHKKEWVCHGIECRVAGFEDLVTNISRGGRALPIAEAMKLSFGPHIKTGEMKKKIISLAKQLSIAIEKENDMYAELGIDLAMDINRNIWIIESNVRPTYNGFKKHMDYKNYLHLCCSPLGFASSMAGF